LQITDPVIVHRDNLIRISYEIVGSTISEFYEVMLEITKVSGERIQAKNLNGDVGRRIPGGEQRVIIWNYIEDNVDLSEELFFQVYAVPQQENTDVPLNSSQNVHQQGATGVIVRTIVLPGLGLTRLNNGKPHWIKGIVGYSCIAGSVYYNRKAIETFDNYLAPMGDDFAPDLYDKSVSQDNISEILAYAAIGIWVSDLVWTVVSVSKQERTAHMHSKKGISVGTRIEPAIGIPLIALRYSF
jgi:hypothetical protein